MLRRQQTLRFPVVPTLRQRLLAEVYRSTDRVLTFDSKRLSLVTYHWYARLTIARCYFHYLNRPVYEGERVRPDGLRNHRETHQFLGPCCICPLLKPLSIEPRFKEAAIYMPLMGLYKGEYVAECVESRCGYLG